MLMQKNKSFTLIELLVVIVIIGILAGVIMISTSSSIDKANIAKSKVFEESVQNNLSANMVSRWKLDDKTGTSPYYTSDAWGSSVGTFGNGATSTTYPTLEPESKCVSGKCMSFDGGDYINCGTNSAITNIVNNFTLQFWANPTSTHEVDVETMSSIGGTTGQKYVIGAAQGNVAWGDGHAGAGISVGTNGVSVYEHSAGTMPPLLVYAGDILGWNNIVVVYKNRQPKLYINGLLVRTGLTSPKTYIHVGLYGNDYGIGKSTGYGFFDGSIDDVRIYNAALSSSQIKQNYIVGLDSMLSNRAISGEEYNQRISELAYEK